MTIRDRKAAGAMTHFLEENPWPGEWAVQGKPVEYFFRVEFPNTLEEIWALISDTSRINEVMGLPRMTFHEEEGRTYGSYTMLGMRQEWYEVPWEWVYGRFIRMERIFRSGFARYQRAFFIINDAPYGPIPVSFYFGWIPRNLFWTAVLKAYEKRFIASMKRALGTLSASSAGAIAPFILQGDGSPKLPYADDADKHFNTDRFRRSIEKLQESDIFSRPALDRFSAYLVGAPDDRLFRLRPRQIAREAEIRLEELIPVMLYLTKAGVLDMSWEIVCPNCRGIKDHLHHLWETPGGGVCDKCSIDFRKSGLDLLEIAFRLNPEIKMVDEVLFCSAEPAKKPQVLVQKKVGAGEAHSLRLPLSPGRYRLIRMDTLGVNFLDIDPDDDGEDVFWSSGETGKHFTVGPDPVIRMQNDRDEMSIFVVQDNDIDRDVLRPSDLFNFQEFRDLFPDEKLADGISINIGMQNILFADVAGSSGLYRSVGDARAFAMIRQFYREAHNIARACRGAIVKTIGDAVMLSFSDPQNALRAALRFVSFLDGSDAGLPLRARVTVNRGPCLAVNLNSAIDYFGNPVNTAAKLQAFVAGGEIGLTRDFVEEPSVTAYLKEKKFSFSGRKTGHIKGIGDVDYWLLRARRRTAP